MYEENEEFERELNYQSPSQVTGDAVAREFADGQEEEEIKYVTVLDFDGPSGQTYSTNQDRTAAFKCTDASFTINSAGGVSLHPDFI